MKNKIIKSLTVSAMIFCTLGVTGCIVPHIGDVHPISKEEDTEILALDAKQRVVVVTHRNTYDAHEHMHRDRVFCAEPSPDALSAISSTLSGNLQNNSGVVASLASGINESAGSIGLRTQSIQLLRDGMYRTCEAYASGAISQDNYDRQQRRYQNLMLSLLAIEQLTGAVTARQIGLGGGSSSSGVNVNNPASGVPQTVVVSASSVSATVNFDPANRTTASGVSDTSVRYVAEAARTIVSTTLIASFAQEECAKLDEYFMPQHADKEEQLKNAIDEVTKDSKLSSAVADEIANHKEKREILKGGTLLKDFLRSLKTQNKFKQLDENNVAKISANYDESISPPGLEKLKPYFPDPLQQEKFLIKLAESCANSSKSLLNHAELFFPQYETAIRAPLNVLRANSVISIAPEDQPIDLFIVGGVAPYQANITAASDVSKEIAATIPEPDGNTYKLHIQRPNGANKAGSATIIVLDSVNAHVEIPITLTKAPNPTPPEKAKTTKKKAVPAASSAP